MTGCGHMTMRSWLLIPGEDEQALHDAAASGADAVIVDLTSPASMSARDTARRLACEWLEIHRRQILEDRRVGRWVRINPLDSRLWREDLQAVMIAAPDGIVVPRADGPEHVQQLGAELYELEQRCRIPTGHTKIIPVVGQSALAALSIPQYVDAPLPRLAALTWGAEDLADAIGASRLREADGDWAQVFRFVRAQALLAAHARGIPAIDAPAHGDAAKAAELASGDGFSGMLARDVAQVQAINAAFAPSEEALAQARAIVAAFASRPEAGSVELDRRTIDRQRLQLAQRLLGIDDQGAERRFMGSGELRPA